MSENNFRSHFLPFQIDTQLFFGGFFLTKWPPAVILDGTTMSFIELVQDIWMSNACVKFEECSLNPSKVIALTTKLWRGGGGGGVADENIIFPKTYVSREYNYKCGASKMVTNTFIPNLTILNLFYLFFISDTLAHIKNSTVHKIYNKISQI